MRMKEKIAIALLGVGTIGSGVLEVLEKNSEDISNKSGASLYVKKVLETNQNIIKNLKGKYEVASNFDEILEDEDIKIIVELIGRDEPAHTFILRALQSGRHVVTANKDVISKYGAELFAAAEQSNVTLRFEASVGGGIPIIQPLKECLAANRISRVMGIVNGTTNYMLTKMSNEKADYPDVLKEAQAQGYAESDPTADVGGFDAARKIVILSSIAFNTRFNIGQVSIEGITHISSSDIDYADEFGYTIKLLAIAEEASDLGINMRVHPTFLPKSHPLANVNGVFNAIYVTGDAVGDVMFYGRGAGKMPTASAVCADLMEIAHTIVSHNSSSFVCGCYKNKPACMTSSMYFSFYIRLLATDKPGVLSAIAAVFGSQDVSIRSVVQKRMIGDNAELVIVTHKCLESNLRMAEQTLNVMPAVVEICSIIRVEDDWRD